MEKWDISSSGYSVAYLLPCFCFRLLKVAGFFEERKDFAIRVAPTCPTFSMSNGLVLPPCQLMPHAKSLRIA